MHVLIRRISPYTAEDVLLGIFRTHDEAQASRRSYLEELRDGQREDPWREQAYKPDILADEDLEVLDLSDLSCERFETGDRVFVVSVYSEGFGQVVREIRWIARSEKAAKAKVDQINQEPDDFPHYALVQEVIVGQEISDSRDSQPKL